MTKDVTGPVERVTATAAALDLIDRLVAIHGPVLFHQSGGCCDGSFHLNLDTELGGRVFVLGKAHIGN